MKKTLFLLLLATSLTASAQVTVTGKVVDKYGNPISGARVEGKGSSCYTFTNMDGSYELETPQRIKRIKVESAGMNYEIDKASNGTVTTLKPQTWWNRKPERGQWFAGLQMHIPTYNEMSFGLMAGWVKYFGFYVRGVYGFGGKETEGQWSETEAQTNNIFLTGVTQTTYSSIGGGGICRIGSPLYLYFGVGWQWNNHMVECTDNKWREYSSWDYSRDNPVLDYDFAYGELGIMFKYNRVFVNAGIQLGYMYDFSLFSHVGIGMFF